MTSKNISRDASKALLMCIGLLLLQSCGFIKSKFGGTNEDVGVSNGEIVATARKGFKQSTPAGMVEIPSGSFIMGQTDEDMAVTMSNLNKRVTISSFYMDDTEISNNEYRQFIDALLLDSANAGLDQDLIMKEYYPDTTVWQKDFTYTNAEPMVEYYYSNPSFDTYPVVGVSWNAANYFNEWRTKIYNDYRIQEGQAVSPSFRLSSEAEWEWAARGGRNGAKYPWGNPYTLNAKGCYLANFKPQRGNYQLDNYTYTAPVNAYNPNDYGLYNMAGNVSEWTADAYADNASAITWDLNPENPDKDEPRKVVKGGSWKDVSYFLQTSTRAFEPDSARRSYLGFRSVMMNMGANGNNARR